MIKRAQLYSHLEKVLASVLGGPLYRRGLWHMLQYFSGQITAAIE